MLQKTGQTPAAKPPTSTVQLDIEIVGLEYAAGAAALTAFARLLEETANVSCAVFLADDVTAADRALTGEQAPDIILLATDFNDGRLLGEAAALIQSVDDAPVLLLAPPAGETAAWGLCAHGAQGVLPLDPPSAQSVGWRIRQTIEQFVVRETLTRQLRELELANGRFLSLVVDNSDAIVVVDRAGVVRFVNPSAERLLGCSASDLLGQMFGIPIEGVDVTEVDLPQRRGANPTAELRIMRTLWDGERAFIVTMRDVTERKKSERALLIAKQTAEQANEMKSQFLTNMSHELRTPLNAVIGFSELMMIDESREIRPPHYVEYVQSIHEAGMHLLSLINDLLDLSKAESGNTELYETAFDLIAVAQGVTAMILGEANLKGLKLECRPAVAEAWVTADKRLIKQVIINLLSNAIKFTPKGGIVEVSVARRPSGAFAVSVSDTGEGIPQEQIPRAFAAFVQLKSGYERGENSGAGLGLALCKRFVEMHGGEIGIKSQPGVGTSVTFLLPAARALAASGPGKGALFTLDDPERQNFERRVQTSSNDC